jgi:hypothetical protein
MCRMRARTKDEDTYEMRKRKKDKIPLGKRPHGVQNMEPLDPWGIASANLRVFAYKAHGRV